MSFNSDNSSILDHESSSISSGQQDLVRKDVVTTAELEAFLAAPLVDYGSQQQEARLETIIKNQEIMLATLQNLTSSLPSMVENALDKYYEKIHSSPAVVSHMMSNVSINNYVFFYMIDILTELLYLEIQKDYKGLKTTADFLVSLFRDPNVLLKLINDQNRAGERLWKNGKFLTQRYRYMAVKYKHNLHTLDPETTFDDKKFTVEMLDKYDQALENTYSLCMYFTKVQVLPGKRHAMTTWTKLFDGDMKKVYCLMLEHFVARIGETNNIEKAARKNKKNVNEDNRMENSEEYANLLQQCEDLTRNRAINNIDISGVDPAVLNPPSQTALRNKATSSSDMYHSSNDEEEDEEEEEEVVQPKPTNKTQKKA
ncbi:hypothetical protein ABG067_007805, partial [Albugo candida]